MSISLIDPNVRAQCLDCKINQCHNTEHVSPDAYFSLRAEQFITAIGFRFEW